MPPALFALVVLEIGSYFLSRPAWTAILLFYSFLCSWDDVCTITPSFFYWDRVSRTFFFILDWPRTMTLLISASM
jgi:hypothetical protein